MNSATARPALGRVLLLLPVLVAFLLPSTAFARDAGAGYDYPVITLIGGTSIEVEQHTAFVDPGATAWDATDGDLTSSIKTYGSVDTAIIGDYYIYYWVIDSTGMRGVAMRHVAVIPSRGPTIAISTSHTALWPPNGRMTDVGLSCDASEGSIVVMEVTQDEPLDAGPRRGGAILADAEIDLAADGGIHALRLRAERHGDGHGRIYHIRATAIDRHGRSASDTCTVIVPHDRNARRILWLQLQAEALGEDGLAHDSTALASDG